MSPGNPASFSDNFPRAGGGDVETWLGRDLMRGWHASRCGRRESRTVGEWPHHWEEITAIRRDLMREEWRGSPRRWPDCSSLSASRRLAANKGMASVCTGPGWNVGSPTALKRTGKAACLDLVLESRVRWTVRRSCWSCPRRRGSSSHLLRGISRP